VTNPDAKGIDPDNKSLTCGDIQEKAEDAKFTVDECSDLMNDVDIFKACGCKPDPYMTASDADSDDDKETTKKVIDVPDMSSKIVCSICGDGYVVTMPDATGIDPEDEAITCGEVQELAEDGKFTAEECAALLNDVDIFKTCGCSPDPINIVHNTEFIGKKNEKTDDDLEDEGIPLEDMSSNVACSICGDGYMVTIPDAKGIDPDNKFITCGDVQEKAEDGKFTAEECADLRSDVDIFKTCGCEPDPSFTAMDEDDDKDNKKLDGKSEKGITLPDMSSKVPCSICGDGYMVTNPDAGGIDPNDESITCGELQEAAENGDFSAEECAELLNDVEAFKLCGCARDPYLKTTDNKGVAPANNTAASDKAPDSTGDSPSHDSHGKSVSGSQGCELSVIVKCIPPKDTKASTCDELLVPEFTDCESTPKQLTFKFQGGICNKYHFPQNASEYLCQDFGEGAAISVDETNYIEALPPRKVGDVYFEGTVKIGDTFVIEDKPGKGGPLDEEILVLIYENESKTNLLQMVLLHTKCNDDLTLGDKYGALQLMSFGNMDMSKSFYRNVTLQVIIGNPTDGELHIQHVLSIGDQKVVDLLEGEKELALASSGELSIIEELAIDIMQPRVISVSATVVGRDDKLNTCVAMGELAIEVPDHMTTPAKATARFIG
jgi:hypothetical protein